MVCVAKDAALVFHAESMVGKPLSLGDGSQIMRIVLLDAYTSLVLG